MLETLPAQVVNPLQDSGEDTNMQYEDQQTLEYIENLDALPGHAIVAALEDEWFRQGWAAAKTGQDSAALWSDYHQAGHRAYTSVMRTLPELRGQRCAN